jgi:hypothetical protein
MHHIRKRNMWHSLVNAIRKSILGSNLYVRIHFRLVPLSFLCLLVHSPALSKHISLLIADSQREQIFGRTQLNTGRQLRRRRRRRKAKVKFRNVHGLFAKFRGFRKRPSRVSFRCNMMLFSSTLQLLLDPDHVLPHPDILSRNTFRRGERESQDHTLRVRGSVKQIFSSSPDSSDTQNLGWYLSAWCM